MKWLIKYLLLGYFIIVAAASGGQTTGLYYANLKQSSNNLSGKITGEIYYLNPKANNYFFLHKEWVKGKVVYKTGEVFENIDLRYQAFNDELIAYNENNRVLVKIDKEKVKEFTLNFSYSDENVTNPTFVNIDSVSIFVNTNYFECLYRGTVMLLVSSRVIEKKVTPYNDSNGEFRDSEFILRKASFIYSIQNGLNRITYSNHSVANVYPEQKREIKKILRQNKIKISDAKSAANALEILDKAGLLK